MTGGILVHGYGNPGRQDDGLGPALIRDLAARAPAGVRLETGYQLQIEDAPGLAGREIVVFADASVDGAAPFELRAIEPRADAAFTTHAVAPEAILALAREHFGSRAAGYVLGIRGYEFGEYEEGLSVRARENLAAAVEAMERWLREGSFAESAVGAGSEE